MRGSEGILRRNDIGRWEVVLTDDGNGGRWELTSGEVVEVKVANFWIRTRIEHNGKDYYATTPGIRLYDGMPAQIPL